MSLAITPGSAFCRFLRIEIIEDQKRLYHRNKKKYSKNATAKSFVEHFLREKLPEQDKNVELINQIIDHIIANCEIIRVDDVVSQLNISTRTLQRMFRQ